MDTVTIGLLLIVLTATLLFILKRGRKQRGLPPGPTGLPIVGSYFQLLPRAFLTFHELTRKYGDVISVQIGHNSYVVLTSYKAIKEALIERSDNFSGRMPEKFLMKVFRNSGIANIDGPVWQEHRRFSLQTLRDFGFGRNLSADIILNECQHLCDHLDEMAGSPVNMTDLFLRTITNVICTMMFSEQPGNDPNDEFAEIFRKIKENIDIPIFMVVPVMFPQMVVLHPIMKHLPLMKRTEKNFSDAHGYIIRKIEEHRKTLDPNAEPRDFTDVYLQQQMKLSGQENSFTDWQLIQVIIELFFAGTDTTANSLSWAILFTSIHPDLQTRVQTEIDENIDRSIPISYSDRTKLNFVQAIMDEVQRHASIVSYSLTHRNFREDKIGDYIIPANSRIIPCIYAAHHDPNVWENPEEFYPQHFLNDQGQYRPREELITFSLGRRACLGESLARMEYFLFFVSLIRRYRVSLDPECEKNMENILLGKEGIVRSPGNHKIIFKIRD